MYYAGTQYSTVPGCSYSEVPGNMQVHSTVQYLDDPTRYLASTQYSTVSGCSYYEVPGINQVHNTVQYLDGPTLRYQVICRYTVQYSIWMLLLRGTRYYAGTQYSTVPVSS